MAINLTDKNPIPVNVEWNKDVSGFTLEDITVNNGTAQNLQQLSDTEYTFEIVPDGDGIVRAVLEPGVAEDLNGLLNLQSKMMIVTYDGSAPSISNATLVTDSIRKSGFLVDFEAADDAVTDHSKIRYTLYTSDTNNLDTLENIKANGTKHSDGIGVTTLPVSGLDPAETVWFNIVAEDEIGHESIYTQNNETSLAAGDTNAPGVGDRTLSFDPVQSTSLTVNFNKATDAEVDDTLLVYKLYRAPEGTDIASLASIDANGTEVDSGTDVSSLSDSGLTESTVYEYNVTVEDPTGNRTAYTQNNVETRDVTAPTATISTDSTSVTNDDPIAVDIQWSEDVQNFTSGDIAVTNGAKSGFTQVAPDHYTINVSPDGDGEVTVNISAGVCQDFSGNDNLAADELSVTYDSTAPAPAISSTESDPTAADPIPIEIDFQEVVSGFEQADITISGGTISGFSTADDQVWTFDVTPDSDQETITIDIDQGVAIDDAGNPNDAADQFSIIHDTSGPIPTITTQASDPTADDPIAITINFNEDVVNFAEGDLTVSGATTSDFTQVDASTYTVNLNPTSDPSDITVDIDAAVCQDNLGNDNVAASQFTITHDSTAPSPTITSTESDPTNASLIPIEVSWSEDVVNFTEADLTVVGGAIESFTEVDAQTFTFNINPSSNEESITVDIDAGVCEDVNGTPNVAATQFAIEYDGVGDTPVITSTEDTYTQATTIPILITFPEEQQNFTVDDITVGNGTKSNFVNNSDGTYTFDLTPTADGACTVDISSGVCTDQAGNNNLSADQFTIFHDTAAPTVSDSTFLAESNITNSGFTANWRRATDAVSDQEDLVYKLYSSLSDNIDTVANTLANGNLEDEGTDVNNLDVTGYDDGDLVYYNVICEDQAGNQLAYTMNSQSLTDSISPTISSPGLSTENLFEHAFDVTYEEASDNVTVHDNMKYHLYISESDNLNSVEDAEANGTFQETKTGELSLTADGLETDTLYYAQVIAEDEGGNKSIYDAVEQKTAKFGDAVLSQAQIFP